MLEFFRSFMKSKFGVALTLGFLILIALAFASGDILSFGGLGGVSSGSKVGSAGSRTVTASSLDFFVRKRLEQIRQQDPKVTLKMLIAEDGVNKILDGLLDSAAMTEFGKDHGIIAGDRLIGSELAKVAAFRGSNGNFDDNTYRAMIGQQGFTDTVYRQLIGDDLVAQMIQVPASFGARSPGELVTRYASMVAESREGAIAMIPSAAFAPKGEPSSADLAAYYAAHRDAYMRPERRVIRYALFDESALKTVPAPTDAEIAARYNTDKAKYAASETRKIVQLVLPTEAAARAIADEAGRGANLADAARAKKLATAELGPLSKDALVSQTSQAVADAVFAAGEGKLVGPVKGSLGWYVVKVASVVHNPGKTLDQAGPEIVKALSETKKRAALADFSKRIEDEFDSGAALSDVAKELGIEIKQTNSLTSEGKTYGKPEETVPADLAKVVQAAFLMEQEGQPQLAEAIPGKFVAFDVTNIQAAAPAPIAEIKAQVVFDYSLAKGAEQARKAADKVLTAARKGGDLAAATAGLGVALPPVDTVNMRRVDLQRAGQAVPPPIALMFAMAQGTVKLLPAVANRGFYVVALKHIEPGKIDPRDPGLRGALRQLSQLSGREYADQLRTAVREEVGVKKNKTSIDLLSKQLSGNAAN